MHISSGGSVFVSMCPAGDVLWEFAYVVIWMSAVVRFTVIYICIYCYAEVVVRVRVCGLFGY